MVNKEVLKSCVKYLYLFKIDTYHLLKNVKAKVACDTWLTLTGSQAIISLQKLPIKGFIINLHSISVGQRFAISQLDMGSHVLDQECKNQGRMW